MNKMAIHTHVIFRPRNAMYTKQQMLYLIHYVSGRIQNSRGCTLCSMSGRGCTLCTMSVVGQIYGKVHPFGVIKQI